MKNQISNLLQFLPNTKFRFISCLPCYCTFRCRHSCVFARYIKLLSLKDNQEVYVAQQGLGAKGYETNSSTDDKEENIVWKTVGMKNDVCLQ